MRLHLESPCRDLGAQNANLGPGLAQIAQPVRIAEICLGKSLKTVLFGAPNGGRLPDGSDRLYYFLFGHLESPCRDLGAQNANLGPGLAQIAQPVRMAEICLGKRLKTVLFGAPNGSRLPDGSDRLYALWSVGGAAI